jgi:inhibitor of KinA
MEFLPLGDQAVMIACRDEAEAGMTAASLRIAPLPWQIDVVQAYFRVAVFYDLKLANFASASQDLQTRIWPTASAPELSRLHNVPCCYEVGLDLDRVSKHVGLDRQAVIDAHSATIYTVYAIGFCPGFPYLGYLPDELTNVPRLDSPRLRVEAGSVGLTGRQTGVYTEARPGGWNIVGRTPLLLCDLAESWFPIRTGDRIKFDRIDETEFAKRKGERLPDAPIPPP